MSHNLLPHYITCVADKTNNNCLSDRYVRDKHPGVTPLTWDDEFRELTAPELVEWGFAKLLEPVIWKYTPDVASYIAPEVSCSQGLTLK